ncbi:FkbM family methyltransferase [Thalassobaculum sp.]|uniref:FkbM family methyltransferase n=1 Tax=Thalassobaculum sp. TaxID=2022740 RepID=UPI0032EF5987
MPEQGPEPWSTEDFYRRGRELIAGEAYSELLALIWDGLPRLQYPARLSIELLETYWRAGWTAEIEAAARRLLPHVQEPGRIAWEAAERMDEAAPSALRLARIAIVLSPHEPAATACLVNCLDAAGELGAALANARRHEALTGKPGQLASRQASHSWTQKRWESAAIWFDRLIETTPDHLRHQSFRHNIIEQRARERAFPGTLPIAGLVDRLLADGDRTSVLFVGARGEDMEARFRGMPPRRLEVIGIDPELGTASDPDGMGIALRYLRDILSDRDEERTFYETRSGGGSSLFPASAQAGRYTSAAGWSWGEQLEVVSRTQVRTTSVDAIRDRGDLGRVDALYVNVQGGELAVLQGGRRVFEDTVAVQVEVSFVEHYAGAPRWELVNAELVEQGFVLVDIRSVQGVRRTRVGLPARPDNRLGFNRWPSWHLAEAHLLYLRDPVDPARRGGRLFRSTRGWLVFALWAEYYGQIDIALEALMTLADEPSLVEDPTSAAALAAEVEPILERYRAYFRRHYG